MINAKSEHKTDFNFEEGETLLINKEINWTSFDIIKKIKNIIKPIKTKIGHAGTLDPLADGLMIVCTGRKTKQICDYQNLDKEYTGSFLLGAHRPSVDLETPIDKTFSIDHITKSDILETSYKFIGQLHQTPPIYSAIKINGTRAYMLARQGLEPELKKRIVDVTCFHITAINLPEVSFRIICSKGTYIRSLVRDFGNELKNGAYLTKLTRTKIGNFKLEDSLTLEGLKKHLHDK
ncbi:MAG: tRNA pseudouridine(55) synthase TruB [Solitalea-like symbiont of Acarus siro]